MTTEEDTATIRRIALAWRELRRSAAGISMRTHLLGPDGPPLEQAQFDALQILASEPGGWRMSEFADALRVDPSTATRAIARLERFGLAERSTNEGDRRVVVTKATAEGLATVRQVATRQMRGMQLLLDPFDETERVQFAEYLERFVTSIDSLVESLPGDRP